MQTVDLSFLVSSYNHGEFKHFSYFPVSIFFPGLCVHVVCLGPGLGLVLDSIPFCLGSVLSQETVRWS